MKSNARSDRLDLERGLPTTAEDVEALRRAGAVSPLSFDDYLRFLEQVPPQTSEELRARCAPRSAAPFVIG